MSNAALTSLAILKVNWDEGRDFFDILLPFVCEELRLSASPVVSMSEVQTGIIQRFGLSIPQNTIRTVLQRAAKHGYVKREHGAYRPNFERLHESQFKIAERHALSMHNSLIDKMVAFSSGRSGITVTTEAAEGLLLNYLSEFDVTLLSSVLQGADVPVYNTGSMQSRYLIGSFVNHISQRDPEAFNALETVVKGFMLSSFLYFQETGNVDRRFRGTTVFLDTPFLMRALGYNGDSSGAPCLEMIELLEEVGAHLACFEHTAQEIRGILYACAERIENRNTFDAIGRAFGTLDSLLAAGYTGSDVRLAAATLEKNLSKIHINIQTSPSFEPAFVIDEAELEATLERRIGYENTQARIRDVDSLASVVRIRRGHRSNSIENCKAVFVTTNVDLVRAAGEFFNPISLPDTVPVAVTDARLTNLVWLKRPMKAPDLPMKVIMAQAYAATQPSAALSRKYLAEIQKQKAKGAISADDYIVLRHSLYRFHLIASYLELLTLSLSKGAGIYDTIGANWY